MAAAQSLEELLGGSTLKLGRGNRKGNLHTSFARELTPADLILQSQTAAAGPVSIGAIREMHHRLAKVMAQGLPDAETSVICGYSISRISVLRSDPTFCELLQYYSDMEKEQHTLARADMHERLASVGFDSLEILHERLLDDPASFDNKTLLAVVEASADRTGYGKASTVNHDHAHALTDATIAKIKEATSAGRPLAEEDRGALLRLATLRTAEAHTAGEAPDWDESGGSGVREEGGEGAAGETASSVVALPSVDRLLP